MLSSPLLSWDLAWSLAVPDPWGQTWRLTLAYNSWIVSDIFLGAGERGTNCCPSFLMTLEAQILALNSALLGHGQRRKLRESARFSGALLVAQLSPTRGGNTWGGMQMGNRSQMYI